MNLLRPCIGSPRPSSGYGSSEDEMFYKSPAFGLSTSVSGLMSHASKEGSDGSCPVTPDSVTTEVGFPSDFGFHLELGVDGGLLSSNLDLGSVDSDSSWLRPPLLDDLGLDFILEDDLELELACDGEQSNGDGGRKQLAEFLEKTRMLSSSASPIKTVSNTGSDVAMSPMNGLTTSGSSPLHCTTRDGVKGMTTTLLSNRCQRKPVTLRMAARNDCGGQRQPALLSNCVSHGNLSLSQEGFGFPTSDSLSTTSSSLCSVAIAPPRGIKTQPHPRNHPTKSAGVSKKPTVTYSALPFPSTRVDIRNTNAVSANVSAHVSANVSTNFSANVPVPGMRRSFSELEDHRYSTSPSFSGPLSKLARIGPSTPETKSTILEKLLLTKEPLKANAGSDAMVALSSVVGHHHGSRKPQKWHSKTFKSVLEELLTEQNHAVGKKYAGDADVVQTTSSDRSSCRSSGSVETYELFSDHLLRDGDGLHLGLAVSDDANRQTWLPSQMDDRVFSSDVEDILSQQVQPDDLWMHLSDLL